MLPYDQERGKLVGMEGASWYMLEQREGVGG